MPKRTPRARFVLLAAVIAAATVLTAVHLRYPLPYVHRVFVYQDSDFSDIHRFPARPIAASDFPNALPVARDARVAQLIEGHPAIEQFESWL